MIVSRRLASLPLLLAGLAPLAWMPRALRPHAGPGALPSARPASFLHAVSFALLALVGALLWSAPAEAQTATVLISNTGQTTNTGSYPLTDTFPKLAQAFTTGTNGTGYTVDSVGIDFLSISDTSTAGDDLQVTLNDVATDGAPGAVLCTLSYPATFAGSGLHAFSAPTTGTEWPTLAARTTYFIVVDRVQVSAGSTINLSGTDSTKEDTGGAAGWSISDSRYLFASGSWTESPLIATHQVEVRGALVPLLLIKNTGQTANTGAYQLTDTFPKLAQAFTTGTNGTGYTVDSVGIDFLSISDTSTAGADLRVTLNDVATGGAPGAVLCTLSYPASFFASGVHTFDAPATDPCPTLAASTTYFAVIERVTVTADVISLEVTTSTKEDTGGAAGWSIGDDRHYYFNGSWFTSFTQTVQAHLIVVNGKLANRPATGLPTVLASAEGAGILLASPLGIDDPDGFEDARYSLHNSNVGFSYQWVRVDGDTETEVGTDSARYQRVDADIGKLIKVRVSFTDDEGFRETLTSQPFGPVAKPADPSLPPSTLVSNTGQSAAATATITKQHATCFELGAHGQGYALSSVSIELAAVPSRLTVSLWMAQQMSGTSGTIRPTYKLFDFENPPSFKVGLNKFTAPAGAFAYQNVDHFIVLSGFGSSLSIKETTSDDEDPGGEMGAILFNDASVRALSSTGRWTEQEDDNSNVIVEAPTSRASMLRLALEGSRRASGILASNYAQTGDAQEIVSLGDAFGMPISLGAADRYLIRGFSWLADSTRTNPRPSLSNPFDLRSGFTLATANLGGQQLITSTGTKLFSLTPTRYGPGINVWTAPQGATVAGSSSYLVYEKHDTRPFGTILSRVFTTTSDDDDTPTAPGVSLSDAVDDLAGRPLMAFLGEPLVAMVQNLGQTDNSYVSVGAPGLQVLSQGFTTGSDAFGYRLQGIGINIEGSDNVNGDAQLPGGPTSVSVAVHADSNGKPGAKLFDPVSPTEFGAGHSFFEAPPGTNLTPNTSYVMVWSHKRGHWHRLVRTTGNGEDSGARPGASAADAYYRGVNVGSLSVDSGGNALEIAVYTVVNEKVPFVPGGHPVTQSWLHIPDGAYAGYQFRLLYVTHRGRLPTSGNIEEYNAWVQWEAEQKYNDPTIRAVASEFKAVVCTAADDARTNTGMAGIGVPIHWLDGGWQDRLTLIANSYSVFYGPKWVNNEYGAYVTGNSAHFEDHAMVWTGCDASGVAHPSFPMGAISAMDMVAVGTPRGRSLKTREEDEDPNFAPLGAVDVAVGYAYYKFFVVIDGEKEERLLPLYAISPIFTVVGSVPAEPQNVTGTASGGQVTLRWDPPEHDGGHDITGYKVYWRNPSNGYTWEILQHEVTEKDANDMDVVVTRDVELDADTTTWTDIDDRSRIYGVAAVNQLGQSGRARFVCAVENGCRPPPTPVVKISSDSPLVPSGLRSGDRFRLIFLSSTKRNAESTNIADYNKFVQDLAAAGHADIRAHSAGFRAVACTEAVDARDNSGTSGIGLGIHWLGGAKAVDNYVDFYDGSWDEEVTVRDESGAAVTIPFASSTGIAWTGCEPDGTEGKDNIGSLALGKTQPGVGQLNNSSSVHFGPLNQNGGTKGNATLHHLYGLSYIFEVR